MLYRLEIENFYSVRDRQVLDLRVAKNVHDFPERYEPIFPGSDERVSKVVALFGANGSGKSTILKALAFLPWFIKESFQHTGPLPCERFNDEQSANAPIRLAIELGGFAQLSFDAQEAGRDAEYATYRYELELRPRDGLVREVSHEALRQRRRGQNKWVKVFERRADGALTGSKTFSLSGFSQVVDKIRQDASVIATLALFDHEPSKVLQASADSVFRNILVDRTEFTDRDVIQFLAQNPSAVDGLNHQLQRIDVGIEQMRIVQTASGPAALFRHVGLQADMPWQLESQGTRSFIKIFPLLLLALQKGGIALIDELDISIHPLILPEIIRWFYDRNTNAQSAQLWASCHSVSLLDDLTKQEIVFCEKDRHGRSRVYGLMDVQAVRRSDNLYKRYLGGAFGAVPQIG